MRLFKRAPRTQPTNEDIDKSIPVFIGAKVECEITKVKQVVGKGSKSERVVVGRKMITITPSNKSGYIFYWRRGGYYLDLSRLRRQEINHLFGKKTYKYKLRFDVNYSEPMATDNSIPIYSQELENYMMGDYVQQGLASLAKVSSLLTEIASRPFIAVWTMAFLFGLPIGLPLNSIFNLVPNTIVHWITS